MLSALRDLAYPCTIYDYQGFHDQRLEHEEHTLRKILSLIKFFGYF